jgi:hypothetical protein
VKQTKAGICITSRLKFQVNFTQGLSVCEKMNMEMVIITNFDQMEPLRQKLPKGDTSFFVRFLNDLWKIFERRKVRVVGGVGYRQGERRLLLVEREAGGERAVAQKRHAHRAQQPQGGTADVRLPVGKLRQSR